MKQKIVNLYTAEELRNISPSGFEKAKQGFINSELEFVCSDIWADMQSIAKYTGIYFREIDLETGHSRYTADETDCEGIRFAKYFYNNYLTDMLEPKIYRLNGKKWKSRCQKQLKTATMSGYLEEKIFDDFWKFNDFEDVANYIAAHARREYEGYSNIDDSYFIEMSDINGYTYTEDGKLENETTTISKGA